MGSYNLRPSDVTCDMEIRLRPKSQPLEQQIGMSRKVQELIATVWIKLTQETKRDNSLHNRQLKRGKSDTNLERLEDLITDGVCVAGDLELTQDTTPELTCQGTSLSSGILRPVPCRVAGARNQDGKNLASRCLSWAGDSEALMEKWAARKG